MAEKKKQSKKITTDERIEALIAAAKKTAAKKPTTASNAKKSLSSSKSTSKSRATANKKADSYSYKSTATNVAAEFSKKSPAIKAIAILLVIAILGVLIFGYFWGWFDEWLFAWFYTAPTVVDGELTIHFLELGNKYTGDSIFIKAGDTDILVDAGSRAGSAPVIQKYINQYTDDGVLEFVIATHADQDHIAAFAASNSIFDMYEVETIIDFGEQTNKKGSKQTTTLKNYYAKRDAEVASGANHFTALECVNEVGNAQKIWDLTGDGSITLEILYHEFYENSSNDENDYSVCFILNHGGRYFLFTGDLEKKGEASLVKENTLPEVELFKAGHHGSGTSSNDELLEKIKPKIVCVCCCAGSSEYTSTVANQFPTQAMIDRVALYTTAVYVTTVATNGGFESMNGNIRVISKPGVDVYVDCSNNNLKLFETEWLKKYRTMPTAWANAS